MRAEDAAGGSGTDAALEYEIARVVGAFDAIRQHLLDQLLNSRCGQVSSFDFNFQIISHK
jgi:hypothetical protein